jgi:hypothetical protein
MRAARHVEYPRRSRAHFSKMTKLTPVRKGRSWRVQITAPNGSVRLFGRFYSEKRAREWIAAYPSLTTSLNVESIVPEWSAIRSSGRSRA